jgi:hypothetical protein
MTIEEAKTLVGKQANLRHWSWERKLLAVRQIDYLDGITAIQFQVRNWFWKEWQPSYEIFFVERQRT